MNDVAMAKLVMDLASLFTLNYQSILAGLFKTDSKKLINPNRKIIMETIGKIATDSLRTIIMDIASALPGIIGAIIVLILAWLIIKITTYILKKIDETGKS